MNPTRLFVYGTLRHDQPEHAKYCRGVLGWRPARIRGRLVHIIEGYRLIVVVPDAVVLAATRDAAADERARVALAPQTIARAAIAMKTSGGGWIDGELLEFHDAALAWPPLDAWENFAPDRPGVYPRVVVPVEVRETEGAWRELAAWAYVAIKWPAGAIGL